MEVRVSPSIRGAAEGLPAVVRPRAERVVVLKALDRSGGRYAGAAKLLGVSRPTLYALMEAHDLSVDAVPAAGAVEAESDDK